MVKLGALKNQHQCTKSKQVSVFFRCPLKFHLSFLHLVLKYLRSLGLATAFDSTLSPSILLFLQRGSLIDSVP